LHDYLGQLAAAGTATCWSFTSMFFAAAGRRIGSFPVNQVRIAIALALLTLMHLLLTGRAWTAELTHRQAALLAASGVIGLVLGDTLLFRSFVVLGVKRALIVMTLWPLLAYWMAWPLLDEAPTGWILPAMLVTLAGVALSIQARGRESTATSPPPTAGGLALALGGAVCQALGYVLAKPALAEGVSSIAGTQIRMAVGAGVLWSIGATQLLAARWTGRPSPLARGLRNPVAMAQTFGGAFCGPFLGVWLSLEAVRHTRIGVATAIMATAPILVMLWSAAIYRERPRPLELAGAALAVAGVALLFLAPIPDS
jgi:drug/metabolite transporter (DMT)-like permease